MNYHAASGGEFNSSRMCQKGMFKVMGKNDPRKGPLLSLMGWIGFGLILFAFGFLFSWTFGLDILDECWYLQVVRRIMGGELLYRDVCFEITPFSVYVASLLSVPFGPGILVIKSFQSLCFSLSVMLSCGIIRRFNPGSTGMILSMVLFCLMYCPAYPNSLYTPLSYTLLLGCLYAVFRWIHSGNMGRQKGNKWLIISGVLAGSCAYTKQNIGFLCILALFAVVSMILFIDKRKFGCHFNHALCWGIPVTFILIFVFIIPVWISGGMKGFLYHGVTIKGIYLKETAISYWEQLRWAASVKLHLSWSNLQNAHSLFVFLLPFITFPVLLAGVFLSRGIQRNESLAILTFSLAGFLGAYPRWDFSHITYTIPMLMLGLLWTFHRVQRRLKPEWRKFLVYASFLWIGTGLIIILRAFAGCSLLTRNYHQLDTPYLKYSFIHLDEWNELKWQIGIMKRLALGKKAFIIGMNPGFYYLAADIRNPTPYDYPVNSVMGIEGENKIMAMIDNNQIPMIIVMPPPVAWMPMWPHRLVRYVETRMQKTEDSGFCTVFLPKNQLPPSGGP